MLQTFTQHTYIGRDSHFSVGTFLPTLVRCNQPFFIGVYSNKGGRLLVSTPRTTGSIWHKVVVVGTAKKWIPHR